MSIKKKFTKDEYNILPDQLNNMMILNRSTNSFHPKLPDDFKNKTHNGAMNNIYSQSSLAKVMDNYQEGKYNQF